MLLNLVRQDTDRKTPLALQKKTGARFRKNKKLKFLVHTICAVLCGFFVCTSSWPGKFSGGAYVLRGFFICTSILREKKGGFVFSDRVGGWPQKKSTPCFTSREPGDPCPSRLGEGGREGRREEGRREGSWRKDKTKLAPTVRILNHCSACQAA